MYQFGLKLWSTNDNYMVEAVRLHTAGVYSYIELYAVPGSFAAYHQLWAELNIPYVIHAAHFRGGMNLAKKGGEAKNLILIKEAQQFADRLKADKIIVHAGIAGDIRETARQLKQVNDKRILIENKPYHALDDGLICNGTTPAEIKLVMDTANVRFCLDIGHAICSANAHHQEPLAFIDEFINLRPSMYHFTDGDIKGTYDDHRHIAQGNYDIKVLLAKLPPNALMTIETLKASPDNLADFQADIRALKQNYERS